MQSDEYARMRQAEDHYWWFVARRRLALQLLDRHCPAPARMLDLGCGTGAVLTELARRGTEVGLDVSDLALEFCAQRGLPRLVRGDAQRVPLAAGEFDAVVSLDTLEHVLDDRTATAEACRVLRPGGVFVLNVPAFRWLWGPHDVALMHHRRYTARQVRDLLESQGFEVRLVSYSVFALFPVVVFLRFLDKFRWGPPKVSLPRVPAGLNRALVRLMDAEAAVMRRIRLPWGSSIVAVAHRRDDTP